MENVGALYMIEAQLFSAQAAKRPQLIRDAFAVTAGMRKDASTIPHRRGIATVVTEVAAGSLAAETRAQNCKIV